MFSRFLHKSLLQVGTGHGLLYMLKLDLEDIKINSLPYYVPTSVISKAVGISLDHVVVVRVLHQPYSNGKRLLVVYANDEPKDEHSDDKLELEEEYKEINYISWVPNNGLVVAVGYVDGDMML
ncbi:unnamed protein product [Vicia faba]|uniref:Uncharacterized protein n=1 Tax=Vicia faba TaxID=3906 RepID=A0AAV0ZCY3_VICFA|nr:unnamed protein product [Vicia faba]